MFVPQLKLNIVFYHLLWYHSFAILQNNPDNLAYKNIYMKQIWSLFSVELIERNVEYAIKVSKL